MDVGNDLGPPGLVEIHVVKTGNVTESDGIFWVGGGLQ